MAVDEALNLRFRKALAKESGITEKKMMGGMCFLLNGNMLGGADRTKEGEGRFMFRLGKGNEASAAALPHGEPVLMGGRRMSGMYFVHESKCDAKVMAAWLKVALENAKSLPPK